MTATWPFAQWRQLRLSGFNPETRAMKSPTGASRSTPHPCGANLVLGSILRMVMGVPKEIKDQETRVGLVPSAVIALREAGHEVLVEASAGEGSSITDREYMQAGAAVLQKPADVW